VETPKKGHKICDPLFVLSSKPATSPNQPTHAQKFLITTPPPQKKRTRKKFYNKKTKISFFCIEPEITLVRPDNNDGLFF
jgi:hypothetical protein